MSKGSPEVIKSMCLGVPRDYDKQVMTFASSGARVIAMASKMIDKKNKDA